MKFTETQIAGAYEIDCEPIIDSRGFFARTWCKKVFAEKGLNANLAQCSLSFNQQKGTLRGMHYQVAPYTEAKLIRCTQGAIYDVILDLRPSSNTYKGWTAVVLSAHKRNMLYVPEGCAHGFLTLADDSEVFYQISEAYRPEAGRGVRWNDPAFHIPWPERVDVISERDRTYPDFRDLQ